jgi:hypothetical protein
MATEKKVIDWEKIELDYRANVKTLRQIADEHGITHGSINKRAKRDGWVRDLSAKIKAKTDELVSKSLVSSEVSKEKRLTEKQIIDEGATALTNIRLGQRKDIQRSRKIAMSLFDELEHQVGIENVENLEKLGELLRTEDDKGRDALNDLYMKIISMPGRVKSMKDLSDTLKTLIALERQAFGLDDENNKPVDALTALLERVSTGNSSAFKPIADDPEY